MCGKFYDDDPADNLSFSELLDSVRAVDTNISPQEEKIIEVLFECTLVPENRIPPPELLAEARRIWAEHQEKLVIL